ncbi:MAG: murein peptide amidase A, partial [Gammaproteobacteria bacterium]|nr:murein peptide amidase A [Gammaproteobacteria bacterium]
MSNLNTANWISALVVLILAGNVAAGASVKDVPRDTTRQACDRIAKRLASVKISDCDGPGYTPSGSTSVKGFPLFSRIYPPLTTRKPQARILLIGGIHGDELSSVSIVFKWMRILNQHHSGLFHWKLVPVLNPDGLLRRRARRMNANGVDLNRNFSTPDWTRRAITDYWIKRTHKNPRRYPGTAPLSEPESHWL